MLLNRCHLIRAACVLSSSKGTLHIDSDIIGAAWKCTHSNPLLNGRMNTWISKWMSKWNLWYRTALLKKAMFNVQYFLKTIKSHVVYICLAYMSHWSSYFGILCVTNEISFALIGILCTLFHNLELGPQPSRCQYKVPLWLFSGTGTSFLTCRWERADTAFHLWVEVHF